METHPGPALRGRFHATMAYTQSLVFIKGRVKSKMHVYSRHKKEEIVNLYIYTCNVIARHLPII